MGKKERAKCAACGRKTVDPKAKSDKCRGCRKTYALDNALFAEKARQQDAAPDGCLSGGEASQSDITEATGSPPAIGGIERRMIERAVSLFTESDPPNRTGEFTTSNYSQALDEEFGSPCDAATCVGHLKGMDGVSRISESVWCRNPPAAGDAGGATLSPVDLTATMTNILHLLGTDDNLMSGRSLAFILGDQVLSDVGGDLGGYIELELSKLDEFGDFAGGPLGFRSTDDLEELVESLVYDGADEGFRVGLVVAGFLAAALHALEVDGRIIRVAAAAGGDPLFSLAGRDGFVIVSKPGDACDCGGAIGKDGHCHNCGGKLFGLRKVKRSVLKHMDACGCGETVGERGWCDNCGAGLADTGGGLTPEDWQEIYDSLESQSLSIEEEDGDDTPGIAENWRRHLRSIMAKIGPDGQDMVPD